MARYVGNWETGIYHDRLSLTERCNAEGLVAPVEGDSLLTFSGHVPRTRFAVRGSAKLWRLCGHCRKRAARDALAREASRENSRADALDRVREPRV